MKHNNCKMLFKLTLDLKNKNWQKKNYKISKENLLSLMMHKKLLNKLIRNN